jgi:hypothetical protein
LVFNFAPSDDVDANLGLVGVAYTGEFADKITVKGEFSWLFGQADMVDIGGVNNSVLRGHNLYSDVAFHNDLMTVGAAFVYGSGDTMSGFNANAFNVNFITADEFVFGNIIASGNGGLNDAFGGGLGFCDDIENLTAAKLYFEIYPLCCGGKLGATGCVAWMFTMATSEAKVGAFVSARSTPAPRRSAGSRNVGRHGRQRCVIRLVSSFGRPHEHRLGRPPRERATIMPLDAQPGGSTRFDTCGARIDEGHQSHLPDRSRAPVLGETGEGRSRAVRPGRSGSGTSVRRDRAIVGVPRSLRVQQGGRP